MCFCGRHANDGRSYTHSPQNYQRPLGSVGSVDIGNTSSIWRGLSINSRCTLRYVRTPWSRCKLLINKPIPIGCTHLRAGRNHTGPCCVVRWVSVVVSVCEKPKKNKNLYTRTRVVKPNVICLGLQHKRQFQDLRKFHTRLDKKKNGEAYLMNY